MDDTAKPIRDAVTAGIRTGVAFIATWFITTLTGLGIEFDPEFKLALSALLFAFFIAVYNFLVGLLERKVHPIFGILLGIPKAPTYSNNPPPAPAPEIVVDGGNEVIEAEEPEFEN